MVSMGEQSPPGQTGGRLALPGMRAPARGLVILAPHAASVEINMAVNLIAP
jgi:hypothetical protein